ncbi:hypothetical protein [Actinomadura logoneensis]|uniref:hypothetical protein n=1 Tax=Actinomadura logoneensis TaxID=2293572 RepID=UPI0013149988|nr:hypothetical protein [Actinomadura logoneensis]
MQPIADTEHRHCMVQAGHWQCHTDPDLPRPILILAAVVLAGLGLWWLYLRRK